MVSRVVSGGLSMRYQYGINMVSIWYQGCINMVSRGCQGGYQYGIKGGVRGTINEVSMWYQCGINMVSRVYQGCINRFYFAYTIGIKEYQGGIKVYS